MTQWQVRLDFSTGAVMVLGVAAPDKSAAALLGFCRPASIWAKDREAEVMVDEIEQPPPAGYEWLADPKVVEQLRAAVAEAEAGRGAPLSEEELVKLLELEVAKMEENKPAVVVTEVCSLCGGVGGPCPGCGGSCCMCGGSGIVRSEE